MNLSIRPVNQNSLAFGRTFPVKYKELKVIPGLKCACCGGEVINPTKLHRAYAKISKPLATMLKKGAFNTQQGLLPVWNYLNELAQKFPNASFDSIMDDKETYNTMRANIYESLEKHTNLDLGSMKDYEIESEITKSYNTLLSFARKELRSSSVVMSRMATFKKYLTGEKLATFEQLQIYAQKYPRKTLSEILKMDEIYKFHSMKDILQRAETREKLDYHFSNISKMVMKINPEAEDALYDIKNKVIECFDIFDVNKRKEIIKQMYLEVLEKYGCLKLKDKVFAEIEQFPTTFITKDSFLAYVARNNFDDIFIIYSLIKPYVASFEHIVPRHERGKDNIYNGLVMCRQCNKMRDRIPYQEFIQYHPEMPYNIQKQILQISDLILNGKLGDSFNFWPINVAKTIEEYSEGAIKPDISSFCKRGAKKFKAQVEQRGEAIESKKQEVAEKKRERDALIRQLDSINGSISEINRDQRNLEQELNQDYSLYRQLESYLKKK